MSYDVMIVDDSQTMRKIIRRSLDLSGMVIGICCEEEAIRRADIAVKFRGEGHPLQVMIHWSPAGTDEAGSPETGRLA